MMRGELDASPATGGRFDKTGEINTAAPLEEWEIRKIERQRKKEAEQREAEEKEAEKQLLRDIVKEEKDIKKKLKQLKSSWRNSKKSRTRSGTSSRRRMMRSS